MTWPLYYGIFASQRYRLWLKKDFDTAWLHSVSQLASYRRNSICIVPENRKPILQSECGRRPLFASLEKGWCISEYIERMGFFEKREFSGKGRSYKRRSHRFYYNFTEIIITIPLLTRILNRLIEGGISLYGNGV